MKVTLGCYSRRSGARQMNFPLHSVHKIVSKTLLLFQNQMCLATSMYLIRKKICSDIFWKDKAFYKITDNKVTGQDFPIYGLFRLENIMNCNCRVITKASFLLIPADIY